MIQTSGYRRIVYSSRAVGGRAADDHLAILEVSRRNNGMDGISGILWCMKGRFLQLLEGPPESVSAAFARIARDPRHDDIRIIDDREVPRRQFADWAMAGMPGDHPDDAAAQLKMLLRNADSDVVGIFAAA